MAQYREVVGSNPVTVYWMDVSNLLAITFKEKKLKIKVAKWGTQNKTKKKTGVHGCTHREEGYY
jgi:hypothetical protein